MDIDTEAVEPTAGETLFSYRVAMMEELGFSGEQAIQLAEAKRLVTNEKHGRVYFYEVPVYWGDLAKMLEHGATHEQILHIIL